MYSAWIDQCARTAPQTSTLKGEATDLETANHACRDMHNYYQKLIL